MVSESGVIYFSKLETRQFPAAGIFKKLVTEKGTLQARLADYPWTLRSSLLVSRCNLFAPQVGAWASTARCSKQPAGAAASDPCGHQLAHHCGRDDGRPQPIGSSVTRPCGLSGRSIDRRSSVDVMFRDSSCVATLQRGHSYNSSFKLRCDAAARPRARTRQA